MCATFGGNQITGDDAISFCTHCGHPVSIPLPVEPLYSAESVCALVPITYRALQQWLNRNRGRLSPAQYRWWNRKRIRLFTANDIILLRHHFVSPVRYPPRRRRATEAPQSDAPEVSQPGP